MFTIATSRPSRCPQHRFATPLTQPRSTRPTGHRASPYRRRPLMAPLTVALRISRRASPFRRRRPRLRTLPPPALRAAAARIRSRADPHPERRSLLPRRLRAVRPASGMHDINHCAAFLSFHFNVTVMHGPRIYIDKRSGRISLKCSRIHSIFYFSLDY